MSANCPFAFVFVSSGFRMASRSPAVMFVVDATANSPVDAVSASESVVVLKAFCGMVCSLPDHPASQSFLDGRGAEENVQTVEVLVRGDLTVPRTASRC